MDGSSFLRKASTCTQIQKIAHTTQTLNIHALSGIQNPLRASEDSSCLRALGCRDRQCWYYKLKIEILVAVNVKINVSWVVAHSSSVDMYRIFGGI
jgi:hypothetical protein